MRRKLRRRANQTFSRSSRTGVFGSWQIEDVPGNDEVTLQRKFGNEQIRLIFSIADLQTAEEYFKAPEGEEGAPADADAKASYPLRCSFTITNPSIPGALSVDAVCQEGVFVVENVSSTRIPS